MSKKDELDNGDTTQTRRVKLAIGGAVLEFLRKWGVAGGLGYLLVAGDSPLKPAGSSIPRKEFETYVSGHEKWGVSELTRIGQDISRVTAGQDELKQEFIKRFDRMELRMDRALDKRVAFTPGIYATNGIALRP